MLRFAIWAIEADRRDTQNYNTNKFDYALASLNAKFFKGRWVVLGAVRRDSYFFKTEQQIHQGDYPADWNAQSRILRPPAPDDYASFTYTPVDAQGRPPLSTVRHSASHVMAAAIKRLFPDAHLGVGPAIEDGFYYDIQMPRPFTPEDLSAIEEQMAKIIAS